MYCFFNFRWYLWRSCSLRSNTDVCMHVISPNYISAYSQVPSIDLWMDALSPERVPPSRGQHPHTHPPTRGGRCPSLCMMHRLINVLKHQIKNSFKVALLSKKVLNDVSGFRTTRGKEGNYCFDQILSVICTYFLINPQ